MEIRAPFHFLGQTRLPPGSTDLPDRMGQPGPLPPVDSFEIASQPPPQWRASGFGMGVVGRSDMRVEANKPNASMAVIDGFGMPGLHGESTSAMARSASGGNDANILRVERPSGPATPTLGSIPSEGFGTGLDGYLRNRYTSFADTTRQTLENIRTNQPRIRDVSQSEGVNAPALTREALIQAQNDPAFARNLARELGLPESTSTWLGNPQAELAMARRVQRGLSSSPEVAASQDRLAQEIERGRGQYTYFNSAGNDGEIQQRLAGQGFTFEPRWAGNVQSTSGATRSVGAAIPDRTPVGSVARSTNYSQRSQASVAMPGENLATFLGRQLIGDGTSFATPLAAGIHNRNPRAYERMLRNGPPPLDNNLGAGLLM